MKNLKTESIQPLYYQVMERINRDIEQNIYPVGSRIPSEHELEMQYGVSRVTVRRALTELTAGGRLERKQGKGTFVSVPRIRHDLKRVHSFHDACRENGLVPATRVIHVKEMPADAVDVSELHVPGGSNVVETLRVRFADDEAVVLEKNHFSLAYAYLEDADLSGSLYHVLREFGVEPKEGTHDVSMIYATESQAKYLNVKAGDPLMRLHEVIYDQKGRPLHNSVQLIRGDRFVFRI